MSELARSLIMSPRRIQNIENKAVWSKEIKDTFQEVLTPCSIVSDMLDQISQSYGYNTEDRCFEYVGDFAYNLKGDFPLNKTFFEPACGTGNFLLQVIIRKLKRVHTEEQFFRAITTCYGVDIQSNNVLETRLRIFDLIEDNYTLLTGAPFTEELAKGYANILEKNIIMGNTIYYNVFDHGMKQLDNQGNITHDSSLSLYESTYDDNLPVDSFAWYDKMYLYHWSWGKQPIRSFVGEKDSYEEFNIPEPEQNDKNLVCKFLYHEIELEKNSKTFSNSGRPSRAKTPKEPKEPKPAKERSTKSVQKKKQKISGFSSLGKISF